MLPRLQAEERLNAITDGALAFGSIEPREARDAIAILERAAGIKRPKPQSAGPATLAAMGIGVSMPEDASEQAISDG